MRKGMTGMKVTVLGRWGAYPEAGDATAGYLLQTDRHNFLLDCGSGVLSNLYKHLRHEELSAVLISHFHYDHCADLGCLIYAAKITQAVKGKAGPLPILANNRSKHFTALTNTEYSVGREIHQGKTSHWNGLKISFAQTVHDEYNLAMRFEYEGKVLVYTGDLGPDTQLADFCAGADLLICEASLYEAEAGLIPWHLTSCQAGELAEKAGVKALMLTHFPHQGDIRRLAEEAAGYYSGNIRLAETNRTWQI